LGSSQGLNNNASGFTSRVWLAFVLEAWICILALASLCDTLAEAILALIVQRARITIITAPTQEFNLAVFVTGTGDDAL